jgi:hypothetical protein
MPERVLKHISKSLEEQCYDVTDVKGHLFAIRVVSLRNFSYTILDNVVPQEAVDNAKPETRISFFMHACIFHGNRVVGEQSKTAKRLTPYFNQVIDFKLDCSQLAPEMRIGITLFVNHAGKDLPLAWINIPLVDYLGRVQRGSYEAGMWIQPKKAQSVGSCESDSARKLVICLEFEKTPLPLAFMDFSPLPDFCELDTLKQAQSERPTRLFGPYKSEISSFRKVIPTKQVHPLLGEQSMFGLHTFNRIQDPSSKSPSIGSSRLTHQGSASPVNSPSQTLANLHTRAASNPSIILGARRSPQTIKQSDIVVSESHSHTTSPVSETKPINIAVPAHFKASTTGLSVPETSVSPTSIGSSSPQSDMELAPGNHSPSSLSSSTISLSSSTSMSNPIAPSTSPNSIEPSTSVPESFSRLNIPSSLPARSRKSYAVSASPPVPFSMLEPGNMSSGFSAALSPSVASSTPLHVSNALSPLNSVPMTPPPPSGVVIESSGGANEMSSTSGSIAAPQSAHVQPLAEQSQSPPNSEPSPLANTMWSKTVARANLSNFAKQVSPHLTTERLISHLQEIDRICKLDPLTPVTDTQKQLIWAYRKHLIEKPESFPKLFLAPNLTNAGHRAELHRIVKSAPLMPPEQALQLLDHKYPDAYVRAYAVRCLVAFGDEELASYLLQLVQVLQYESLYLAPLASFLVERAILNPLLIGQGLLWHLQAELHRPETETKFSLLMEAILLGLKPALRSEFCAQIEFVAKLVELNDQLSTTPPSSRTAVLRKSLASYIATPTTTVPRQLLDGLGQPTKTASSPLIFSSTVGQSIAPTVQMPPSSPSTPQLSISGTLQPFNSENSSNFSNSGTFPQNEISQGISENNSEISSSNFGHGDSTSPIMPGSTTSNSQWASGTIGGSAPIGLPPLPAPSPTRLVLPLSSSMVVKGVLVEKCKVMDSAAFPLWLTFENEDPWAEPISVLFKFGDDLRQDALTLQMFSIMDRIWKREGLDMKMSLYKCLPTGLNMGMIEVVPHAETTARIQKEAGGIMGAFKQTPLSNWLKSYNTEPAMLEDAISNFTRSCAAYCVATYVIGVGDRHNDNIMVTKSGKLFHIDFAHFLGNIIKFGAYKRERAPFVLTPEFAYVMGGEKSQGFAQFKALACNLYNSLRKHSSIFISLFELMLFAGLTQLSSHEDLTYLKKSLLTNVNSEQDAQDSFSKLIDESLSTKSTQLNFAIHIFAHPD